MKQREYEPKRFEGGFNRVECKFCGREDWFVEVRDVLDEWVSFAEKDGWEVGDFDGDDVCPVCKKEASHEHDEGRTPGVN